MRIWTSTTIITNYNKTVTDAASEKVGKECCRKKPWVAKDVLNLCDESRDLKKWYEAERAEDYREANKGFRKAAKKSKGGLEMYSVQGDRNLPEQEQQQESIPTGKGSNLREIG